MRRLLPWPEPTEALLAVQHCVFFAVAQPAFDIERIVKESRLLIDATGAYRFMNGDQSHLIRL